MKLPCRHFYLTGDMVRTPLQEWRDIYNTGERREVHKRLDGASAAQTPRTAPARVCRSTEPAEPEHLRTGHAVRAYPDPP